MSHKKEASVDFNLNPYHENLVKTVLPDKQPADQDMHCFPLFFCSRNPAKFERSVKYIRIFSVVRTKHVLRVIGSQLQPEKSLSFTSMWASGFCDKGLGPKLQCLLKVKEDLS